MSGLKEIPPLTDRAKEIYLEKAFKVDYACRITRQLHDDNLPSVDLFNFATAINAWPFVTSVYSGLEQAMKLLLTMRNALFKRNHNLSKLFMTLEDMERSHVERHFKEYRSLHEYDTNKLLLDTAARFMKHLDTVKVGRTTGYTAWRYILIEDDAIIPAVHIGTMLEMWEGLCCIIRKRAFSQSDNCSRLANRLVQYLSNRIITSRTIPSTYQNWQRDITVWEHRTKGGLLSSILDLLNKEQRGLWDSVEAPEALRSWLRSGVVRVLSDTSKMPDIVQLLANTRDEDWTWNPYEGVFQRVRDYEARSLRYEGNR